MCEFKSGIIFKNRVVLAPMYNDSHSVLLRSMNIEDNYLNMSKMFVRVELLPKNGDKTSNVDEWRFKVDQDIVPNWYEKDPGRYEEEFRKEVKDCMKDRFQVICGQLCVKIKEDEKGTYFKIVDKLFNLKFGENNNYATSFVRENLKDCDFANALRKEYGNRLVPITLSLRSLDGLDDYGIVEGDILSLVNIDLYRECRKNILNPDECEWLATPDSTPSGYSSDDVRCVDSDGFVSYAWRGCSGAVRPFFILKS